MSGYERLNYLLERINEYGAQSLLPRDAAELVVTFSAGQENAADTVNALFSRFGTVQRILDAGPGELSKTPGVDEKTALLLPMARSFYLICRNMSIVGTKLSNSRDAEKYCADLLGTSVIERMILVTLTDDLVTVSCDLISEGTTFSLGADYEKIQSALRRTKTAKCIIAHNHPGGSAEASLDDLMSTYKLRDILFEQGILLLDHIIIGRGGAMSMFGK